MTTGGELSLDVTTERLKRRYLNSKNTSIRGLRIWSSFEEMEHNKGIGDYLTEKSEQSSALKSLSSVSHLSYSEKKQFSKALRELRKAVKRNTAWFGRNASYLHDPSTYSDNESSDDCSITEKVQDTGTLLYTEADVTLPSNLNATTTASSDYMHSTAASAKRTVNQPKYEDHSFVYTEINQIYAELLSVHHKLQQEKKAQHETAMELEEREHFLTEKEVLLSKHQDALTKIKGVEEEIHTKFRIMKEQYDTEIKQLSEALKNKMKENKRLKSSFDTLKEMNDSLKKEISEVSAQNKKLEMQGRKVQARLENLQRKHEFLMAHKGHDTILRMQQEIKPPPQEKVQLPTKLNKVPLNTQVYEFLVVLMDWISDSHLRHLNAEEHTAIQNKASTLSKESMQSKCIKILPMVTEQLQFMPSVNPKVHLSLVTFAYWTLRQLDFGEQQKTMFSTLRRLGEEIFRGTETRIQNSSPEQPVKSKAKTAAFFKSTDQHLRFVSTLIVLKTLTQADLLAQAFDALHKEQKTDEGKSLFLEYHAVPVILNHLRASNKGLLSSAVDIFLQMAVESRFLQPFLEICSCESFFRNCSILLRNPKLEIQILEKLSIILQKLSRIKRNKKLFEIFAIHLIIQEMHRTMNSEHAFLSINLSSLLFNLGMTKNSSFSSSQGTS
ncbi:coiled-coil domain-containing protein 138 [Protopterus annectens]|uniref:coiled-coil domain-containing protein 138 n=1 Tax=Protopterus annectens TaxID=7888 RepID=UPI001CFAA1CA|nr:coiled-coil domain-containing protein 138 [Protopterus annectens]